MYLSATASDYAYSNFGIANSVLSLIGISVDEKEHRAEVLPFFKEPRSVMVTASTSAKVKRLGLIAKVFRRLQDLGVIERWIHFGSDSASFFSSIGSNLELNPGIECRGELPNAEFRSQLRQIHHGIFLNLSESEGLPITILEAAVARLPVVASEVGVVSDIVDKKTGLLIPKDASDLQIALQVKDWLESGRIEAQTFELRNNVVRKYDSREATTQWCRDILNFHK